MRSPHLLSMATHNIRPTREVYRLPMASSGVGVAERLKQIDPGIYSPEGLFLVSSGAARIEHVLLVRLHIYASTI